MGPMLEFIRIVSPIRHFSPAFLAFSPSLVRPIDFVGFDIVIWGITAAGRPFRPSDWADRVAGLTSAFGGDHKLIYSPLVLPITVSGTRAVVVGHELEAIEPRLFRFLITFAQDNALPMERMQNALASPHALVPPALPATAGREPSEPV